MNYTMMSPCAECPFLTKHKSSYTLKRLKEFSSGEFACHKTCEIGEESMTYDPKKTSAHCAGALIFLEKMNAPHQMMRIVERLGGYDHTKLDMDADVR